MIIDKKPTIQLPAETVTVPSLGGDVIVQGLTLSQRFALFDRLGADGQIAHEKSFSYVPCLLGACVVDAARKPFFSEEEWDIFGAAHQADALMLFDVARRLSGLDLDAAKKN